MKEDLAENYSTKKWFNSLGVDKRNLSFVFLATLLGGIGFTSLEWLDSKIEKRIVLKEAIALESSYYEDVSQKVRIEDRNNKKIVLFSKTPAYLQSFARGALVLFVSTSVTSFLASRSDPDDADNPYNPPENP